MTNRSGYMNFDQAIDVPFQAGQFWELHPDDIITGHEYDDMGNVVQSHELTNMAQIVDFEAAAEPGYFRIWGDQLGEPFNAEAWIDSDTRMRLVDAR